MGLSASRALIIFSKSTIYNMKSIFHVLILFTFLAFLPACKNDSPATAASETAVPAADAPPPGNRVDTAPIKVSYLPSKVADIRGCNCNLSDENGVANSQTLLSFSFTNPATVIINDQIQTMEEQNPVNTAPDHRIIRVFKNENFVVSAVVTPKGTVQDEKALNEYVGEITLYNLKTKEMLSKKVSGQCGCR